MKKLYTFLCAVAVTALTAGAATPQLKASLKREAASAAKTEVVSVDRVSKEAMAAAKKMAKTASAKAPELNNLAGSYCLVCVNTAGYAFSDTEVAKGASDNEYVIKHFMYSDFNDIPATASVKDIPVSQTETVSVPCLSIKGSGQVAAFTEGVTDYLMYLGENSADGIRLYNDDIDFLVTDEGLIFLYEGLGIGIFPAAGGSGFYFNEPNLFNYNGDVAYMDSDANGNYSPKSNPILFIYSENTAMVFGYAGFFVDPFVFTFDGNTVTTKKNLAGSMYDENDEALDFYWCALESNAPSYTYAGSIEEDNGKTYVTFPQEQYAFAEGKGSAAIIKDVEIEINDLVLTAGVKDLVAAPAEEDVDAPVEYYNLQGVRVAEPAAGLYIRRQGKTVSKVVIR